ncbi:resuscitation-promoting factor [Galactobacter caseinivorans]|uniref:DUF348 domain-containing protein n=1 Tax=Galactobacter caseinivorans TaxID=2676123 RepID=A0A496PJK3_9MICC|nr:resuscitation-promoting factor [Galactobacter caseinivorans]RKW70647.1 DUF348 domain-containing protein [Galactobacter caseinivorans]
MDKRGKRWLVMGAQGITLSALVVGTAAFVSSDKTVQLSVDGESRSVQTFGSTVHDALRAAGLEVDGHDQVSPGLDDSIADGSTVNVRLARDVTVVVDGTPRTVQTTAQTAGDLADQLGLSEQSKLSLGENIQLASSASPLSVTTPKSVTLNRAGKTSTQTTTALDVAGFLKEQGVTADSDDTISPAGNTVITDGMEVEWANISTKKVTEKRSLKHLTQEIEDDDLVVGEKKTTTKGKDGSEEIVYEVRYRNGEELGRKKSSAKTTKKPVAEVVSVGTKTKKEAAAEAKKEAKEKESKAKKDKGGSSAEDSSGGTTSTGGVSGVWSKLAKCESGGNWGINTGNGYYGGLQFTKSTWDAMGGGKYAAFPHQASASEQVAVASKLQKRAGWGQWPACTSKLGLR